jgi:hypothetical protein
MMGALCHPIAVDLYGSGTAGDSGDNLGLCLPQDAPVGNAPFTDGAPLISWVVVNPVQVDSTFLVGEDLSDFYRDTHQRNLAWQG